jgi:hypothetical protein
LIFEFNGDEIDIAETDITGNGLDPSDYRFLSYSFGWTFPSLRQYSDKVVSFLVASVEFIRFHGHPPIKTGQPFGIVRESAGWQ